MKMKMIFFKIKQRILHKKIISKNNTITKSKKMIMFDNNNNSRN